ncbi:hypothetical protein LMG28688_01327 [Paraburkholderia caffeinitolerans]|uniref:Uncharacterized protein n=3 Tax=Paraburkholderia TaxID=1822464 RepID=A0A6J5FNC7_9BURK|nr:hypothetical protein LMG28688_01327 [Paraburkholderia caffeinitolerans]CAB3802254.1 hypothetical protein LMG28690_05530 [Paraburkholderia caffeinilytica]
MIFLGRFAPLRHTSPEGPPGNTSSHSADRQLNREDATRTMTTNETYSYTELTTHTEQTIQALMDRAGKLQLPKAQRQQQTSMAHGALALWHRLVGGLSDPSSPNHTDQVKADHERLKALIRRPSAVTPEASSEVHPNGHLGRTPPTRRTYGLHWHRVQRSVRNVLAPSFGTRLADDAIDWHDMWEDVATSTFIHLHQLKDWFPEPVNEQANAYIDEHEPLQICADLANTAKHAWLDPARGGTRANVVARPGGPAITIPLGRSAPGHVSRAKVEIRIALERGGAASHLPAVELVGQCFELWRQFIVEHVAAGELDNVEHGSVWINEGGRLRPRTPDDR